MSTVQASLRSQAHAVGGRLTELVSLMNRLLNRSSGSSSYATFFYAQFDEQTRRLTYVNAGHNPPIIVRAAGRSESDEAAAAPAAARHRAIGGGGSGNASAAATSLLSEEGRAATGLLTTGGPVIGLFETFTYEQETIQTRCGDVIVAYTDGLTEALNPKGIEFGEKRLHALVTANAHLSAPELTEKVFDTLRDWCLDTPQHDDMTLVVMKVR
jgi:sigma-B regulation protein RsbU (phosphoserine phosphatase)